MRRDWEIPADSSVMQPAVVVEFLLHALNHDSVDVQAIAAVGIAKLMLSGMLPDAEVRSHRFATVTSIHQRF